nr:MAG TPA: hypothetical protein [Caudoviricetes sp.]
MKRWREIVTLFYRKNLDEIRLINFILDNYKNLCYNLITIKERRK